MPRKPQLISTFEVNLENQVATSFSNQFNQEQRELICQNSKLRSPLDVIRSILRVVSHTKSFERLNLPANFYEYVSLFTRLRIGGKVDQNSDKPLRWSCKTLAIYPYDTAARYYKSDDDTEFISSEHNADNTPCADLLCQALNNESVSLRHAIHQHNQTGKYFTGNCRELEFNMWSTGNNKSWINSFLSKIDTSCIEALRIRANPNRYNSSLQASYLVADYDMKEFCQLISLVLNKFRKLKELTITDFLIEAKGLHYLRQVLSKRRALVFKTERLYVKRIGQKDGLDGELQEEM